MAERKGNPFRHAVKPVLEELRALRQVVDAEIAAGERVIAPDDIPPDADWRAFGEAFNACEQAMLRLRVRSLDFAMLLDVAERITRPPKKGGDA